MAWSVVYMIMLPLYEKPHDLTAVSVATLSKHVPKNKADKSLYVNKELIAATKKKILKDAMQ